MHQASGGAQATRKSDSAARLVLLVTGVLVDQTGLFDASALAGAPSIA
jgi:hypothetical protein